MEYVSKVTKIRKRTAPGRVVVVVPEHHPTAGDGRQFSFAACRWRVENGRVTREVTRLDLGVRGVWEFIRDGSRRRTLTTIYLPKAKSLLEMLGFSELLTTGDVSLLHRDDWQIKQPQPGSKGRGRGTVSLTPGSVFIDFTLVGGEGRFKIVDLDNFFPDLALPADEGVLSLLLVTHAVRDWHELLAREGLGRVRCTIPAQALEGFRARFLPVSLHYRRTVEVCRAERAAYFGGRCECFRLGLIEGPVYELDTKSCYLSITRNAHMPVGYLGEADDPAPWLQNRPAARLFSLSDATVQLASPSLPFRIGRRVIYPIGTWRGIYTDVELWEVFQRGAEPVKHRTWWYEAKPIFTHWSRWSLELKDQLAATGNPELIAAGKRLGVSLFGKLGQRAQYWQPTGVDIEDEAIGGGVSINAKDGEPGQFRVIAGQEQISCSRPCPKMGAPVVAGYVTALGRLLLQARMDTAGPENVFYVDTDCLFVNQDGYERLREAGVIRPDEPGYLRLVSVHDWIVLHSPKHYITPVRRVHSGKPPLLLAASEREAARNESVNFAAYYHGRVMHDGKVVPWRINTESPGPGDSLTEPAATLACFASFFTDLT